MIRSIIIIALIVLVIRYITKNFVIFYLPDNSNPEVFGSPYWNAFHSLSGRIPCINCREDAEKFINFFHDHTNKKIGKEMLNPENYEIVKSEICS